MRCLPFLLLLACGGPHPPRHPEVVATDEVSDDTSEMREMLVSLGYPSGAPFTPPTAQEELRDEVSEVRTDTKVLKHYLQDRKKVRAGEVPTGWKQPDMSTYERDPKSQIPGS